MKKILIVDGMSCQHCVSSITEAIMEINGVKSVEVNLDTKEVIVEGNDLDDNVLTANIDDIGFEVKEIL